MFRIEYPSPATGRAPGDWRSVSPQRWLNTGGVWLGWSGESVAEPSSEPNVVRHGNIDYATIDLTPAQVDEYYNGYCNGTLWPLFHYFPEVFRHEQPHYEAYQAVNELFARAS